MGQLHRRAGSYTRASWSKSPWLRSAGSDDGTDGRGTSCAAGPSAGGWFCCW
jgi:hypothetical protein